MKRAALLCISVFFAVAGLTQDLASFEKKVTVKKLPNGLTLVLAERHEAPVFSFLTFVDTGDAQDPKGQGGLAHMFEHMAFKGTPDIGSTNYPAEKVALATVETAFTAYERQRRRGADEKTVLPLRKAFEDAVEKAQQYVKVNEYSEIIERNGGEGVNASTSMDETQYFYSMPSNRFELWAYLESERFLHPVFREFYKERDVVHEERRLRVDSNPVGSLLEQFVATAFIAHPYKNEGIGFPSELDSFSASDAAEFFRKNYVPSNMVVAVVGDVYPKEALPILERYFGRIPAKPHPDEISLVEPPQKAEKTVVIREAAQPVFLEGYHRPDYHDPDDNVYDVLQDLLSSGRTSRLYRALVRDKKIAVGASGFSGFPGGKYANLFAFFARPARGHTPDEVKEAVHVEIARLINEDITDDELRMVKTRVRADMIRGLADNEGLAENLALYQTRYGDWRELFRQIDKIDKVTKADIRRVAARTFVPGNRTTASIEFVPPSKPPQAEHPAGQPQGAN
jgi:predicted Zn-dependent peptidase